METVSSMQSTVDALLARPYAPSPFGDVAVNKDVVLYHGKIRIHTIAGEVCRTGDVVLRHLPKVELVFQIKGRFPFDISTDAVDVLLEGIGCRKAGRITHTNFSLPSRVTRIDGVFTDVVEFCHSGHGTLGDNTLNYIVFHLVNMGEFLGHSLHVDKPDGGAFNWAGKASFGFGEWVVRLDEMPDASSRRKEIAETGGNGITTMGYLARKDGTAFSAKEADDALKFMYWLLAFINGSRIGVVLVRGIGDQGQIVYERWSHPKVRPYHNQTRWYPEYLMDEALSIADTCYRFWLDPDKQNWFRLAVSIYAESTQNHGGTEVELTKACMVLELLCSVCLRQEQRIVGVNEFDSLKFTGRLRRLLTEYGIPTSIPTNLTALAGSELTQTTDGPGAIVQIRNAIVHLDANNRLRVIRTPGDVKFQAWYLSVWYVEMIMLHLFGYRGQYNNRINIGRMAGGFEKVPWAS